MPSNATPNYALNQWSKDDRVLMDDFNADNVKIDAALGTVEQTVSEHSALLPKLGNCQFYTASYVGAPNGGLVTHTFPHKPWFIFLHDTTKGRTATCWRHKVLNPDPTLGLVVTWEGNTVTWFCGGSAEVGMNYPDRNYNILALLDMSE